MKTLIIGGNSDLAVEYIKINFKKEKFFFVVRNKEKFKKTLNENNLYVSNDQVYKLDLVQSNSVYSLINIIMKNKINNIIICSTLYNNSDNLQNSESNLSILDINFTFVIKFLSLINNVIKYKFNIILFGSIASFAGRKNNIIYSASKRALNSFIESFIVSCNSNIYLQYYILGYLNTVKNKNKNISSYLCANTTNIVYKTLHMRFLKSSIFILPRYWIILKYLSVFNLYLFIRNI